MAIRNDYQAGNASIVTGTITVTGAGGANWTAADLHPGDTFKAQNLDAIIASVDSNTQITLSAPWTGTTLVNAPYAIRYQPDGSRYTAALRDLVALLGNGNLTAFSALAGALDLIPIFTGAGAMTLVSRQELKQGIDVDQKVETLAQRAAYDGQAAGYTVLVADVGDGRSAVYFKVSNTLADWSDPAFLTGPNGTFQSKGNYSGSTTYQIGDVVLYNGSSWIARVVTTDNPPPTLPTTSNTQWFLLAAAGNGFVFRGDYAGATAYLKDDVVTNQGSSWIALQATTGNAPPTLPTTSNTYWKAIAVKGTGDVSGPASSVDGSLVLMNGTTGKVIKDGGVVLSAFVKTLLDDANGAAFLASLGVTWSAPSSWNGWVKFPGGLIVQWGSTAGLTTSGGGFAIPMLTAFSSNVSWNFVAYNGDSQTGNIVVHAYKQSGYPTASTGYVVALTGQTGAAHASTSLRVDWIAVGV
ncbi:Carbohydrate binding domain-containing protein [Phyllobacterium sp. YR620]|uniref:hypothetical protein n=1 Tax=Phyllobacterium sp. YR620 TaxID=1881066 RepID=UPI00088B3B5E|nr:hypothetical protein [Phyllobacterium sp. YR620]SDP47025.1 Carbohydrate binding domain-containing protein [Phyllobacterium sp. YR620]